jgi:Delta3-Delta2-enoyl-CoA isomerase
MDVYELHLDLPARNAIDGASVDFVEAGLAAADGGPILLRGTDKAFCAGLNLKVLVELEGSALEDYLLRADGMFRALWDYPGPVVACVEGHAIAGGCVLLQACDLRVCTDRPEVRVGVNELALGACYPPNALAIMQARVPRRHVRRVILGAELYTPARALGLGLLDEVVAQPLAVARERCALLAGHPARAFETVSRALRAGQVDPSPGELSDWRANALPLWASEDLRARIRAAIGK